MSLYLEILECDRCGCDLEQDQSGLCDDCLEDEEAEDNAALAEAFHASVRVHSFPSLLDERLAVDAFRHQEPQS